MLLYNLCQSNTPKKKWVFLLLLKDTGGKINEHSAGIIITRNVEKRISWLAWLANRKNRWENLYNSCIKRFKRFFKGCKWLTQTRTALIGLANTWINGNDSAEYTVTPTTLKKLDPYRLLSFFNILHTLPTWSCAVHATEASSAPFFSPGHAQLASLADFLFHTTPLTAWSQAGLHVPTLTRYTWMTINAV